jgi:large subunit ribosomal protein L2
VFSVEYDPNRRPRIALLHYADGEKRYILAPVGISVGDTLTAGETADIKPGNALPLKRIPVGTLLHNIELAPGRGGQMCARGRDLCPAYRQGREIRPGASAIGRGQERPGRLRGHGGAGGQRHARNVSIGKAGRNRWLNRRPKVRGVAMNPVDHPLGGGEGKSSGGRHPVTPWGKPTKGYKTRNVKKPSSKLIVKRRGEK